IFWDANVITNNGTFDNVGLLHPIEDPGNNQGISFHQYCLIGGATALVSRANDPACVVMGRFVFQRQPEAAARNHSALFLTEFGASDDLVDIGRTIALADAAQVSWDYWQYGEWSDPTTSGSGSQGLFTNDLDRPGSLKQAKADALIRTYPEAV